LDDAGSTSRRRAPAASLNIKPEPQVSLSFVAGNALTNTSSALNVHSKPASKSKNNAAVVHSDEDDSSDVSETFQETHASNSGGASRLRRHTLPSFKRKEID
jgi:hypothetical protein